MGAHSLHVQGKTNTAPGGAAFDLAKSACSRSIPEASSRRPSSRSVVRHAKSVYYARMSAKRWKQG